MYTNRGDKGDKGDRENKTLRQKLRTCMFEFYVLISGSIMYTNRVKVSLCIA